MNGVASDFFLFYIFFVAVVRVPHFLCTTTTFIVLAPPFSCDFDGSPPSAKSGQIIGGENLLAVLFIYLGSCFYKNTTLQIGKSEMPL